MSISFLHPKTFFTRKTKLENSDYYPYAYKVAPGPLSDESRDALDGFTFKTVQRKDGSIEAEFIPHRPWYHYYKVLVKPGYTLYFLEQDDDDVSVFEKYLNDDHPFLVDPDGYIVD